MFKKNTKNYDKIYHEGKEGSHFFIKKSHLIFNQKNSTPSLRPLLTQEGKSEKKTTCCFCKIL